MTSRTEMSSPPRTYPEEWSNEQTMRVLFSPFRDNRDVNPQSWDSKMQFWTRMIHQHCADSHSVVVNAQQLPRVFEHRGQVPACLKVVLEELLRRGEIMTATDYRQRVQSGWLSWSYNLLVKKPLFWGFSSLVKRPVSWAYSSVFGWDEMEDASLPKSLLNLPDEKYVVVEKVKSMSDAIHRRHTESVTVHTTDNIVGYEDLRRACCDICADKLSFELCVSDLCRRKLCSLVTDPHGDKILHMHGGQTRTSKPISESAVEIYKLKTTEAKLEEQIDQCQQDMEECRKNAKECLRQGKKQAALRYLRKKKLLEASIAEKEKAIDNINGIMTMIQEADHNKKVVDAYSSGVQAFKGLTSKHGLNEANIDKVMADIQQIYDENDEINQTMSQKISPLEEDEDELEQELKDLMAAKASGHPAAAARTPVRAGAKMSESGMAVDFDVSQDILDLPDVPVHDISDITPPTRLDQPITAQQRIAQPGL